MLEDIFKVEPDNYKIENPWEQNTQDEFKIINPWDNSGQQEEVKQERFEISDNHYGEREKVPTYGVSAAAAGNPNQGIISSVTSSIFGGGQ